MIEPHHLRIHLLNVIWEINFVYLLYQLFIFSNPNQHHSRVKSRKKESRSPVIVDLTESDGGKLYSESRFNKNDVPLQILIKASLI